MARVTLSLGSNIGERFQHLQTALTKINQNKKISNVVSSSVYETKPVGGPVQDNFLNAVISLDTELTPLELLEFTQKLENEAERIREVRWGPRTLDIDVLVYGNTVINSEVLSIPHPRISERAFVVIPWLEIEPNAHIPNIGALKDLEKRITNSDVQLNSDMKLTVSPQC
jgi:2-amino-4-hydroxy-6-hydroxymethyldihydropteridine diphosphokinase